MVSQRYNFVDADKGARIMVVGGLYKGRKGWRRIGKKPSETKVWVILESTVNRGGHEEVQVNLNQKHVKDIIADETNAQNREQAVFVECPDLLVKLDDFIEGLVEIDNMKPNIRMMEIIWNKWTLELNRQASKQRRTIRFLNYDVSHRDEYDAATNEEAEDIVAPSLLAGLN